jgi:hypothetical protein
LNHPLRQLAHGGSKGRVLGRQFKVQVRVN